MICSKCKTSVADDIKICPVCSSQVEAMETTLDSTTDNENPDIPNGNKASTFFQDLGGKLDEVVNLETIKAGKEKAEAFVKDNLNKDSNSKFDRFM